MPRITAVQPDPRRPEVVQIDIDGARFGTVPRELASAEALHPGQEVGPQLQDRLGAAADVEAAYRTVLRALAIRAHARGDLTWRLIRKGHSRQAVDAAIERAAALGFLDDVAFSQNFVQTRAARGRGPSRLTRDLLAMGVERSVIDRALAAEWPEGSDRSAMPLALATKRAAQLARLPRRIKRRRVLAYLARRGFSGRHISEMVDSVVGT